MKSQFRGDLAFLSNFFACNVTINGLQFHSSEQAFMYFKTDVPKERLKILECITPAEAKKIGRTVTLVPNWEEVKVPIMLRVLIAKFSQNRFLLEKLKAVPDSELTEINSWHDNYWGNCTCGRQACSKPGKDMLGKCLIMVKHMLK